MANSQYDRLAQYLRRQASSEVNMTFREIEDVIGARLPQSAREYRNWWANAAGNHMSRRGWKSAGFKTARVDMGGEKLAFVREGAPPPSESAAQLEAPINALTASRSIASVDRIIVQVSALSPAARRLVREEATLHDGDEAAAVATLLHNAAAERKRRLIAEFVGRSQPGRDSVELIREDRDGH